MTKNNTPRLRVQTIGAGYFARFHLEAWHAIAETDLIGVCDLDEQKTAATLADIAGTGHKTTVYGALDDMFADGVADIIDITTPPDTHLAMIKAALKARPQMIICQKPFCGSLVAAEQATQLAAEAGIPLIVHENFRFQPWFRQIKLELEAGRVGDVYQIAMRLRPGDGQGEDAYLARQPYFRQMKQFLVHETGIHYVDVFRYLLGEPSAVFADLRRINSGIAGEDAGFVLFHFDGHRRAMLDANRCSDHAVTDTRHTMGEFQVEGAKGIMSLNGLGELSFRSIHELDVNMIGHWKTNSFAAGCVQALQKHIVDHLLQDMTIENSAKEYLQNLRIEEAIYRSSETGTLVQI